MEGEEWRRRVRIKEGAMTGHIPSEARERAGGRAYGRRGGFEGVEGGAAGDAATVLGDRLTGSQASRRSSHVRSPTSSRYHARSDLAAAARRKMSGSQGHSTIACCSMEKGRRWGGGGE